MSKPTPVIMGTDGEPIVDPTGDRPTDLELCAVHLLLAAFHYAHDRDRTGFAHLVIAKNTHLAAFSRFVSLAGLNTATGSMVARDRDDDGPSK